MRYFKFFITHPRLWPIALGVLLQMAGAIAAPIQLKQQQPKESGGLKVQQTVTTKQDRLKVQLKSCVKAKPNVVCTLLLSTTKDDVIVWASDPNRGKSRLIDLDGNEYTTFEVNQFGRPETGTLLVSKAPVKLILSFTKLPQNLSSVALMEIGLETYGHEIPVRFRKVNFLTASPGVPVPPPKPVEKVPPAPEQPSPPPDTQEPPSPPPDTQEPPSPPPDAQEPPSPPPDTEEPPAPPPDTEEPPAETPPESTPSDTEQPQREAPVKPPVDGEPPIDSEQSPADAEPPADAEQPSTDKPQSPAGSKKTPTDSQPVPEVEQDTPEEPQQDTTGTETEPQQDSTQSDLSDSADGASQEDSQPPKLPPISPAKSPNPDQ